MKTDSPKPADSFGRIFTQYLNGLLTGVLKPGGIVMQQMWCRPGKTGTLGLLLCLFWQAQYSGVETEWNNNINSVKQILNAIISEPSL